MDLLKDSWEWIPVIMFIASHLVPNKNLYLIVNKVVITFRLVEMKKFKGKKFGAMFEYLLGTFGTICQAAADACRGVTDYQGDK